ncbi:hypothetical protein H2203_003483 [Taxawa tesnikishii (nom. ined.)]|nr:hypothetical protein H2203_003483 [Dothideales sp. JES 119]
MADQYILKVTAGTSYEEKDQKPVHVNSEQAIHVSSSHLDADITIRVQNFRGLPKGSPSTSPYFSRAPHNHDLYSLQFSFTPKSEINGHDLIFGNDFDHPIRDKLPPGFDQAFKIVKWFIDPGLYADVYADEPYLYGPLLSSINTFRIGSKGSDHGKKGSEEEVEAFTEGAEGDGEDHLKGFNFESGRQYSCDFFNPYLDFNDFALKLPGFSLIPGITIPIISYWDGQPLRYVLKNRVTNEPLFVVIFTLVPKDQADAADEQLQAQNEDKNAKGAESVQVANDGDDLD